MATRIYALAKELKIDSKVLVDVCMKAGVSRNGSALASLTDGEVEKVRYFVAASALPKLTEILTKIVPNVTITPGTILGRVGNAGMNGRPRFSSAARLQAADDQWWVPWPIREFVDVSAELVAPIFLWGGQVKLFPTIRVHVKTTLDGGDRWEFFSLDEWLTAAFSEWQFGYEIDGGKAATTVLQRLRTLDLPTASKLKVIGQVIRFALQGKRHSNRHVGIKTQTGLEFRYRDPWLRALPIENYDEAGLSSKDVATDIFSMHRSAFGVRCRRALVLTAEVLRFDNDRLTEAELNDLRSGAGVPRISDKQSLRLTAETRAEGLDIYDTPENKEIRHRLHLAVGAGLASDRQLRPAPSNPFNLSPSSSQIPFAGYDDPRRLLMAAKSQLHAVALKARELPRIITRHRGKNLPEPLDPHGVNLRVGYVAWAGWNHEDAWVLSRTAAKKLTAVDAWSQTLELSTLEADFDAEELGFKPGMSVTEGDRLIRRKVNGAYLWLDVKNWTTQSEPSWQSSDLLLKPVPDDIAKHAGKITGIEVWDFLRQRHLIYDLTLYEKRLSFDEMEIGLRRRYRQVVRFDFERRRALRVGDKLANRHGHKGIVGLILPDDQMPTWEDEPLDALVDPISVLNRGNWGQLHESIAGAVAFEGTSLIDESRSRAEWLKEFQQQYEADDLGRVTVDAANSTWLHKSGGATTFKAMVGVQFVMRMPQCAADTLSAHKNGRRVKGAKRQKAKADIQSQVALWAHGVRQLPHKPLRLSDAAQGLQLRLWLAAVELRLESSQDGGRDRNVSSPERLLLRRIDLGSKRPQYAEPFKVKKGAKGRSTESQLLELDEKVLYYVKLASPVTVETPSKTWPWPTIKWVPVISLKVLERDTQGGIQRPRMARLLEMMCKAIARSSKDQAKFIRDVLHEALRITLGSGMDKKKSWMRAEIQTERRPNSGRAVIAPAGLSLNPRDDPEGESLLGIDEIELPQALYNAVQPENAAAENGPFKDPLVWIKRDPVLHRWAFLPVRCRVHADPATTACRRLC